ncbi:MAG TPA: hypothetical protein PK914_07720 [Smithellaceae bacterium]|nr:hypothetical protein [Smithellaceae bacterium]
MWWLILIVLALSALAALSWQIRVVNFRKNITVGQSCGFYVNSDRYFGTVIMVSKDTVVILNAYGTYERPINEIYPA